MELPEKICPRCRCEYMHTASQCSDCRIPLVFPEELEEEGRNELPPVSQLAPIRVTSVAWARAFSETLSTAGIPHRIDTPPEKDGPVKRRRSEDASVAIYVRLEDQQRAMSLDAEFAHQQIPDLPAAGELSAPQGDGCPACGAELGTEAPECPGCGLYLGEPE